MRFGVPFRDHPEHAVKVANIIGLWNNIENLCAQLLESFVGTDPLNSTALLTSIQGAGAKIAFLRAAGEHTLRAHPALEHLRSVMSELDQINTAIRIRYVHRVYGVDGKGRLCMVDQRRDWLTDQSAVRILTLKGLDVDYRRVVDAFNSVVALQHRLEQDQLLTGVLSSARERQVKLAAVRYPSTKSKVARGD